MYTKDLEAQASKSCKNVRKATSNARGENFGVAWERDDHGMVTMVVGGGVAAVNGLLRK